MITHFICLFCSMLTCTGVTVTGSIVGESTKTILLDKNTILLTHETFPNNLKYMENKSMIYCKANSPFYLLQYFPIDHYYKRDTCTSTLILLLHYFLEANTVLFTPPHLLYNYILYKSTNKL